MWQGPEGIIGKMAASLVQPQDMQAVDLRQFRARDFHHLLEEQNAFWSRDLHWDFASSRDLIRRFLDTRNLYGYALVKNGDPIGYSYFIHEQDKALIGDLFITAGQSSEEAERYLFHNIVKLAIVFPGVRRVEGQLLTISFDPAQEAIYGRNLDVFERLFMLLEGIDRPLDPPAPQPAVAYERWLDGYLDRAAELITDAYRNHVDSRINDQYRSVAGARRFLYNTSQHPGCGVFFHDAAVVARERRARGLCGMSLATLVQPRVGHITQLCVAPHMRRRGVGYELLRRSIEAFRGHGCEAVSLTVTGSNRGPVGLYERVGFRVIRKFPAFVWEAN